MFDEIDYVLEAHNAERFASLYGSGKSFFTRTKLHFIYRSIGQFLQSLIYHVLKNTEISSMVSPKCMLSVN